jgi:hypothetical protein
MKFAPILPIDGIGLVDTNYHFCFAELCKESDIYANFYKRKSKSGSDIVIMDTMVYEGCPSLDPASWMEVVEYVRPTFVLCPDVRGDKDATLSNFHKALDVWHTNDSILMGIAQGLTYTEYLECMNEMAKHTTAIALPFRHVSGRWSGRYSFLSAFSANGTFDKNPNLKFHLLGVGELLELIMFKDNPRVMGADSSKPVSLGLRHKFIDDTYEDQDTSRQERFFHLPYNEIMDKQYAISYNVSWMNKWIR